MSSKKTPYPENLIQDLITETPIAPFTDDQLQGLEYAISLLDEREQQFLAYRYEEHMTLAKIGDKHSITTERARQIIRNALMKLKTPSWREYYIYGFSKATERLHNLVENSDPVPITPDMPNDLIKKILGEKGKISIHELNLDTRMITRLRFMNVNTLYGLVILIYKYEHAFRGIRDFGDKAYRETFKACKQLGIGIPDCYQDLLSRIGFSE